MLWSNWSNGCGAGFDRMGLPPSRARCGSVDALQTVKVQYRCARTREGKGVEIGGIGEALAFVEKHRRKVWLYHQMHTPAHTAMHPLENV